MKFRHEYKHRINMSDMIVLKTRLAAVLKHDSFSGEDGTYYVKSLYFDNIWDKALREKVDGVNNREKFRIRYYGNDTSFIRLEKKSKVNGLTRKESTPITAEECQKIIDGDYHFLLESDSNLMHEFYAKLCYQRLKPRCIVAYRREAFVYPSGNIRITLDSEISGSYNVREFLNPDAEFLRLYHESVLEVKWDEYLPELVRDLVQVKNRKSAAFSKYAAVRY